MLLLCCRVEDAGCWGRRLLLLLLAIGLLAIGLLAIGLLAIGLLAIALGLLPIHDCCGRPASPGARALQTDVARRRAIASVLHEV